MFVVGSKLLELHTCTLAAFNSRIIKFKTTLTAWYLQKTPAEDDPIFFLQIVTMLAY